MTTFKKPTKNQIIAELLPIRKKQMKEEYIKRVEQYNEAKNDLEEKSTRWLKENPHEWINFAQSYCYGSNGVSLSIHMHGDPSDKRNGRVQTPPQLKALFDKVAELEVHYYNNPDRKTDVQIRKMIREELDALDPKSIIDNTATENAEELPVQKEYLEQFMSTLMKVSKARSRLIPNT
jgi:hypothetical protein